MDVCCFECDTVFWASAIDIHLDDVQCPECGGSDVDAEYDENDRSDADGY